MQGDKICYNGEFGYPDALGLSPGELLSAFHFYQPIHTRNYDALHANLHLSIIDQALKSIYATPFPLPAEKLHRDIQQVLALNHYPKAGNAVTLRVFPGLAGKNGEKYAYLLEPSGQLYYPNYTIWHKRMMLESFPCEYLFMGYTTGVSAQTARFSREYAMRQGAELAVIQNMDGLLTNVNDEPLFIVADKCVYTTPCADGANDTVMRRLIFATCHKAGVTIVESGLTTESLLHCDEVFTASVQGLISIEGYQNIRYFNLTVHRLAEILNDIPL